MQKTEYYCLAVLLSICFAKTIHACIDRFVQLESGKIVCKDCMLCGAGYQVQPPCHSRQVYDEETLKKETCAPCKDGEYKQASNGKNNSLNCLPCNASSCRNYVVLSPCTKTSPVNCSKTKCEDGYHKNDLNLCVPISSSSTPAKMRKTSTPWKEFTTTVNTPNDGARISKKYTPNTLKELSTTTNTPKDYTESSYKDTPTTWKELPTTMKTPKDNAKSSNKDATTTFKILTTVVKTPKDTTKSYYNDTTATLMKYNTTMKTPNNDIHTTAKDITHPKNGGIDSSRNKSEDIPWWRLVILIVVCFFGLVVFVVVILRYSTQSQDGQKSKRIFQETTDAPQVPQEDGRKGAEHVPKEDDEDSTQSRDGQKSKRICQETTSFIDSNETDSSERQTLLSLATTTHQPTETVNRAQGLKAPPSDETQF